MDEKRFGVKTHLIKELRRFQSSLKDRRFSMPTRASVNTYYNESPIVIRKEVQTENGRLSIIPSIVPLGYRPPKQSLESLSPTAVRLELEAGLYITIIFDSADDKNQFAMAMATINDASSSSEEEHGKV